MKRLLCIFSFLAACLYFLQVYAVTISDNGSNVFIDLKGTKKSKKAATEELQTLCKNKRGNVSFIFMNITELSSSYVQNFLASAILEGYKQNKNKKVTFSIHLDSSSERFKHITDSIELQLKALNKSPEEEIDETDELTREEFNKFKLYGPEENNIRWKQSPKYNDYYYTTYNWLNLSVSHPAPENPEVKKDRIKANMWVFTIKRDLHEQAIYWSNGENGSNTSGYFQTLKEAQEAAIHWAQNNS